MPFSIISSVLAPCNVTLSDRPGSGSYAVSTGVTSSYGLVLVSPLSDTVTRLVLPCLLPLSLHHSPLSRTGVVRFTSVLVKMYLRYVNVNYAHMKYRAYVFHIDSHCNVMYIIITSIHIPQPQVDNADSSVWLLCSILMSNDMSYCV